MSKRMLFAVSLAMILVGAGAVAGLAATSTDELPLEWAQWRGPHRDAVSLEKGLVDEWGEAGPTILWRLPAGEGFSSVSVSEGKAYTLWDEKGRQLLVCLNAESGKRVWSRELGPAFENHYGNGPRSTPLVDDGMVFAIGTNGLLLAADKHTGETVWKKDMVGEYKADLPSYGYSSSPLVTDDKLVIEAGGANAAFVALEKKTGKVRWTAGNDQPAYSSPIEISVDGVSQVVFWSAHGLSSVTSEDGSALWNYSWETFCPVSGDPLNTGTPIFIAPDRVLISSGSGAVMLRISRDEGKFKVDEVWQSEELRGDVNTALVLDGHIYGFDRGTLKSLDVKTGEVKWKARGYQRGSLIAADGKLIVLGENGKLALLDANPEEYIEMSSAPILHGRSWTSPALSGGKLYMRNQAELVCVDMRKN